MEKITHKSCTTDNRFVVTFSPHKCTFPIPIAMENIRDALPDQDAGDILSIYTPFVEDTVTSFEYTPPSLEEMQNRIKQIQELYPFLVYEEDGKVIGYAYGSQHKSREGYKWVVETSVYLAPSARGKGIGSLLYEKLFEILHGQGFYKVIAGISGVNPASDTFHRKHGFKPMVFWKNLGNKFGRWIDVTWYEKTLAVIREEKENPQEPIPYPIYRKKLMP